VVQEGMTAAAVLLPGRQGQRDAECYEEDEKEGWAHGPHFRTSPESDTTPLTECEKTTHKKESRPTCGLAFGLHQPRHQQQQRRRRQRLLKRTMSEELLMALRKLQHSLDSPPMISMTHHQQQPSLPQELDELIYKEATSADNLVGCHRSPLLLAQQQTYLQRCRTCTQKCSIELQPPQLLSPFEDMNPGMEILFPPPLPFFLSGGCCVPHLLATTRN